MEQEPKEGDEQLGIITEIIDCGHYWAFQVPGLRQPAHISNNNNIAFLKKEKEGDYNRCPLDQEQIVMWRYMQWPSTIDPWLLWQPVLDYFESERSEQ